MFLMYSFLNNFTTILMMINSAKHLYVTVPNFSLCHRVQTGPGAHPASSPVGTGVSFPEGKAAGERRWPLTSI